MSNVFAVPPIKYFVLFFLGYRSIILTVTLTLNPNPSLKSSLVFRLLLHTRLERVYGNKLDIIRVPSFKVLMKRKVNHVVKQTFYKSGCRMAAVQHT